MAKVHDLIKRQYKKLFKDRKGPVGVLWRRLVRSMNESLWQEERNRKLLERTADLNSHEITKRNAQIRAIFETFPDIFFVVTPAGVIVEANGAALSGAGQSPGYWLGKSLTEFPNEEVGRRFETTLARARDTQAAATLEYAFLSQEG